VKEKDEKNLRAKEKQKKARLSQPWEAAVRKEKQLASSEGNGPWLPPTWGEGARPRELYLFLGKKTEGHPGWKSHPEPFVKGLS